MSKFNKQNARAVGRGPVTSEAVPSGRTYEGAPGYARDTKSELFLLGVTNLVGEETFYEDARSRDNRYTKLVHEVSVADPEWLLGFIGWLRHTVNLRSAPLVAALEGTKARLDAGEAGYGRKFVDAALSRPDEPGEALAYWTGKYGRSIPKPVKRGVSDAVRRLYNERALLKWDTASKGYRFADVLNLVHAKPDPAKPYQAALFDYAQDRRFGNDNAIPAALRTIAANDRFLSEVKEPGAQTDLLFDHERIKEAGLTWENVLSLAGKDVNKAKLWEAMIPSMGYMALLRNLRNFDEAGVSDEVAQKVISRLEDADEVARSRQLPLRFLSAYRAAPSLRWGYALEKALNLSLKNIQELPGNTLILVDRSGSMFWSRLSSRSDLTRADAAAVFGSALFYRCHQADLVQFGTGSEKVSVPVGESVLKTSLRFRDMGGTQTSDAVRRHFKRHDRVIVVTDEQAHYRDPFETVPREVPVYTWNVAGYERGHSASTGNRITFGGLSDAAFKAVPMIEAGRNADWPWIE